MMEERERKENTREVETYKRTGVELRHIDGCTWNYKSLLEVYGEN